MKNIAGAIIVVGLATVSAYLYVKTKGKAGEGWGFLAFIVLMFWDWTI